MKLLSQTDFSKIANCSRQNIAKLISKGKLPTENGKISLEHPDVIEYLKKRDVPESKIEIPDKKVETKKPKPKRKTKREKNDFDEPPQNSQSQSSSASRRELEIRKLKAQIDGYEIKNAASRGQLIERESLSDTIFGYLSALNQNIMSMPTGFIDEFESGIKTGMTRAELINILTNPISETIKETKEEIEKEIKKYIRDIHK